MTSSEKRKLAVYRLEPELIDGLKAVKERDGLPITWQVKQAIRTWLELKGAVVKAAPERASARPETLTVNLL
jgi:hypothetical protein